MKRSAALLALVCAAWTPNTILAQTIDTIAGNGNFGLTGDGGPATSATMRSPKGMLLVSGGLLFADDVTNTVRHIAFGTGIITRFAGNGSPGGGVPGADPLLSPVGQPIDLAFDNLGDVLILQVVPAQLIKVTAANTIQKVAGTGAPGGGGDGGPALFASLDDPVAVDTDAAGNIYVLEKNKGRVRKIAAGTNIITTVAGLGISGFSGDGGPATNARFFFPEGLAVTAGGDLYIADTNNNRLRFVNALTGIVTTVAAVSKPYKVALASDGTVLISTWSTVEQYDPIAATVTPVAGSSPGFGGDGGDPLLARLDNPRGIAASVSSLIYVADTGNLRIREIDQTPAPSPDVILDGTETQAELDAITNVTGDLIITGGGNVSLPNLIEVGGNFIVTGNASVQSLNVPNLTTVVGAFVVEGNASLIDFSLGAATSIGQLSIDSNTSLTNFSLGAATSIGQLTIGSNTSLTDFSLGAATSIEQLTITDNPVLTEADLANLVTVNGDFTVSNNDMALGMNVSSLTTVTGTFAIENNDGLPEVSAPNLGSAGNIVVSENSSASSITFPNTQQVGDIVVSGNSSASSINFDSLTGAGNIVVSENSSASSINFDSLTDATGVSITDNDNLDSLDLSPTTVSGDVTVETGSFVAANTAGANTNVTITSAEASMNALLPTGSLSGPTGFTVRKLEGPELDPEMGAGTVVTPIAGHEFLFDVPMLNTNAIVSFTVQVSALSFPDQTAFVQALADGTATVAVKGDNAGDVYQSFPVCTALQSPGDGCAKIVAFDALGSQVPADGSVIPASVMFTVFTDHFSTYAVVIEGFLDNDGDDIDNDEDNCPDDANPDQLDTDMDGEGDACDDDDDSDSDSDDDSDDDSDSDSDSDDDDSDSDDDDDDDSDD